MSLPRLSLASTTCGRVRDLADRIHVLDYDRTICLRKDSHSSHADRDGYVPFGQLEDHTGGRSNGCTSWSPSDARKIIAMVKDDPTTLYVYPEAADIEAVTQAMKAGRSHRLSEILVQENI